MSRLAVRHIFSALLFSSLLTAWHGGAAQAAEELVEKKVFSLPELATLGGRTIRNVRVGYETYGKLNAARDNVVLIAHHHAGTSHAAGRYSVDDQAPGYWDNIIGPGKAIDTDRYFVVSSDTLVNMNVKDPHVVTTGPASIDPETGKPYGMRFPVVTIRDMVNVQKALLDSLGIKKLRAVMGASMGSAQALDWAAAYPQVVERVIAVVPTAGFSAYTLAMESAWAAPILLDPNWKGGDYYGGPEPVAGMTASLNLMWISVVSHDLLERQFGDRWADPARNPLDAMAHRFAADAGLEAFSARAVHKYDANSMLYLIRAAQLYRVGHLETVEAGLRAIQASVLVLAARDDPILPTRHALEMAEKLKKFGKRVEVEMLDGENGHLDCFGAPIAKAGKTIAGFLNR